MDSDLVWIGGLFVVLGLGVMLAELIVSRPLHEPCARCRVPLSMGYEAYVPGQGKICRKCCREVGERPWYLKAWQMPPAPCDS